MKPRAPWLRRFTSWFFNASPEWVPPDSGASTPPDETTTHPQIQAQPQAQQGDAPQGATDAPGPAPSAPQQD